MLCHNASLMPRSHKQAKQSVLSTQLGQQHTLCCTPMLLRSLLVDDLGGTLEATSAAGCNETYLLSWGSVPPNGGGVPNVLVVTTTVWVLHRIHGHATHLQRR
jgi:hypothetical protein